MKKKKIGRTVIRLIEFISYFCNIIFNFFIYTFILQHLIKEINPNEILIKVLMFIGIGYVLYPILFRGERTNG